MNPNSKIVIAIIIIIIITLIVIMLVFANNNQNTQDNFCPDGCICGELNYCEYKKNGNSCPGNGKPMSCNSNF